ncbi:MAG TPA: ABC transporter permease [Puia sp.]|nr:ABC transporter permease [Puia sp.]
MVRNYFLVAIRNLKRNKVFSAINILGLSIGMASAVLILLWVQNEMSYDRFHKKGDRLYEMYNRATMNGTISCWDFTPKIMAPTLKKDYPEVEDAVRFSNANFLFSVGDKHLNLAGNFTDSGFLRMFSFPLVKGNPSTALASLNRLVLTESGARKLFGDEDPMGKTVKVDSNNYFTVAGVLKDLPNNTQFHFDYLLPWSYLTKLNWDDNYWGNNSTRTYITLKPGISEAAFDKRVKDIVISHATPGSTLNTEIFLHPVSKWHLYSRFENGQIAGGQIEIVRLFIIVAIFILLIACINFMNLSTARSEKRAKEVGIRKVSGAPKAKLVMQFLMESVLISVFAGVLALMIVQVSLSSFNLLVSKSLFINFSNPVFWIVSLGFVLITGLVAGSYPAFYLSSFKPAKVLKGAAKAAHTLITPRKILVVLQFSFAIILIISTIIVEHQLKYAQSRDTGYNKDHLVYAFMQGDLQKHYNLIKNELLAQGVAAGVTRTSGPMTQHWADSWGFEWPGSTEADKKIDFTLLSTDAAFVKNMGLHLVQGRDIDILNYPTDSSGLLLNETAVKLMRLKNPVGQTVTFNERKWHIIGVTKDFILESPYQPVNPMIISGPAGFDMYVLNVRLNPNHSTADNLSRMERIFKQYNPSYPFEYRFVDEDYEQKFVNEKRTGSLAALFAGLTIFISCLGLFGLATYTAENRIKEIGVRKVLGASVAGITTLLSKDFLKLVLLAILIASPIAWFTMHRWLQSYPYRVQIEWWVFGLASLLSIAIALFTISFQAIKAALANPVNSLRSE